MRLLRPDPECEHCLGTGYVPVDEYSREGELIGRGTVDVRCICTKPMLDDDVDQDEYD